MAEFSHQVIPAGAAGTTTNTAASVPVYAIIGNGFSSVVNHVTMRWSDFGKARLGRAQVIHIFEKDPWSTYVPHDMGQWTDLLTLPGFRLTPQGGTNKYLRSNEFSENTSGEFNDVTHRNPNVQKLQGRIEKIEKTKVNGIYKYAISVKGQKTVMADFVDVCSGPGEARIIKQAKNKEAAYKFKDPEILFDKTLLKEYNDPNPVGRVVSAQAYMTTASKKRGGSVCIFGTGPLAASCVEQALTSGCHTVFWMAKQPMNASFTPGRRYDGLARQQDGTALPWRQGPPPDSELLIPSRTQVKFGEGFKVAEVSVTRKKRTLSADLTDPQDTPDDYEPENERAAEDKLILIKFALGVPESRKARRFVDAGNAKAKEPKSIVVDQLVISASSQNGEDEAGSTAFLLKNIRKSEKESKFSPIKAPAPRAKVPGIDQVTFGLQTADGKFRVLGTAGLTHEDRMKEEKGKTRKDSRLKLYERSLPDQARVGLVGITMSAVAVAQSNGFFQKNANDCVNIAHPGELLAVWGLENGNAIYDARRQRIDPFTRERTSPDDVNYPVGKISGYHYRYRPPQEYW